MIWPAEWYKPDPRRLCSSFTEQSYALLLCYLCYLELSSSFYGIGVVQLPISNFAITL